MNPAGQIRKRSPEEIRVARDRIFDSPKLLIPQKTIDEGASTFEMFDSLAHPPLPVHDSEYIVVVSLDGEQAHASSDRVSIYTEYSGFVREVIKAPAQSVVIGSQIAVLRAGGKLILPNGRVVQHTVGGQGGPFVRGETYLLFLHFMNDAEAYTVTEAWQLRDGHPRPTLVISTRSEIERLINLDEAAFLAHVRARVSDDSARDLNAR